MFLGSFYVRGRVVEAGSRQQGRGLVNALLDAEISEAPNIIDDLARFRVWADSQLEQVLKNPDSEFKERLHASLGLLPVDPGQVSYLKQCLLKADPEQVSVIREAIKPYKGDVIDELWVVLKAPTREQQKQGLQAASALALYDPEDNRWGDVSRKVAGMMVREAPLPLARWTDMLWPIRDRLVDPLVDVCLNRDETRSETEQAMATYILENYTAEKLDILIDLVLDAEPNQFAILYPGLAEHRDKAIGLLEAELGRTLSPEWKDQDLDPSWASSAPSLVRDIESADGLLEERFAFCQTMPLATFLTVTEGLRRSGYLPTRFRPFASQDDVLVAAVWARDGRDWQLATGMTAERTVEHDEDLRGDGFMPVDVSGYVDVVDGKPVEHYGGIWVERERGGGRSHVRGSVRAQTPLRTDLEGWFQITTFTASVSRTRRSAKILWRPEKRRFLRVLSGIPVSEYESKRYVDKIAWDNDVINVARTAIVERQEGMPEKGGNHVRYSPVWQACTSYASVESHGLSPQEHLVQCRQFQSQSYRPVAMSAAFVDEPQKLATASVWHRPVVSEDEKETLVRRQANAAIALLRLGESEKVWPLLKHSPDPRLRSWLIHRLSPMGVTSEVIASRLEKEPEVSVRRALILALGECGDILPDDQESLSCRLRELYRNDPDPGIHGTAEWVLRHWGKGAATAEIDADMLPGQTEGQRHWYVTSEGHTMVTISGPVEFMMGSPTTERGREAYTERLHCKQIDRSYAVANKETTVEQFRRFCQATGIEPPLHFRDYVPELRCPQIGVSWYNAAKYCRWLSEKEGVSEDQMCYPPIEDIKDGMQMPEGYLTRTGYRLPTEAEWEYACRAGATTRRYYGENTDLLGEYAWYAYTSNGRMWPVGSLKPNDFGLFDMHGNVVERCQNIFEAYADATKDKPSQDREDVGQVLGNARFAVRDGGNEELPSSVRSARRYGGLAAKGATEQGFRVARTRE